MKDIVIVMDLTPGRPADILDDLATQGVNVVGGCLFPRADDRVAHIAVADADEATVSSVAAEHGAIVLDSREVLVVNPAPHGGAPAVARRVSDAGATVFVAYFGAGGEVILVTSDLAVARKALDRDDMVSPEGSHSSTG